MAFIFDIDGTLSDCSHRISHIVQDDVDQFLGVSFYKDYDKFNELLINDNPFQNVVDLCRLLYQSGEEIILVTGRSDKYAQLTQEWLAKNLVSYSLLYMRKEGDKRPDYVVKREIYFEYIYDRYEVKGVFEDRKRVVQMWRSLGITCHQVQEGDY